jgi:hypothetical protein
MTRTDVMASSRPQTAGAASKRRGLAGARRLVIVPVMLLLALALIGPATAVATEPTSGYTTPTTAPKETKTTATTPATGTSPAKESTSPSTTAGNETSPETTKATTLPFTGFDLRWSLGIGVLLILAGFSIVAVQRRHSRN